MTILFFSGYFRCPECGCHVAGAPRINPNGNPLTLPLIVILAPLSFDCDAFYRTAGIRCRSSGWFVAARPWDCGLVRFSFVKSVGMWGNCRSTLRRGECLQPQSNIAPSVCSQGGPGVCFYARREALTPFRVLEAITSLPILPLPGKPGLLPCAPVSRSNNYLHRNRVRV